MCATFLLRNVANLIERLVGPIFLCSDLSRSSDYRRFVSFSARETRQEVKQNGYLVFQSLIVNKNSHLCINNSLHLARKYAQIFVCGHYLFRQAHSFREHSSRKTVSFEEQIMTKDKYSNIFSKSNGGYVSYPSNIFRNTRSFENWGMFSNIPQF